MLAGRAGLPRAPRLGAPGTSAGHCWPAAPHFESLHRVLQQLFASWFVAPAHEPEVLDVLHRLLRMLDLLV